MNYDVCVRSMVFVYQSTYEVQQNWFNLLIIFCLQQKRKKTLNDIADKVKSVFFFLSLRIIIIGNTNLKAFYLLKKNRRNIKSDKKEYKRIKIENEHDKMRRKSWFCKKKKIFMVLNITTKKVLTRVYCG